MKYKIEHFGKGIFRFEMYGVMQFHYLNIKTISFSPLFINAENINKKNPHCVGMWRKKV